MPAHPTSGTGFVGLQQYLDANSGATSQTGHTLADAAAAKAKGAETAADTAAQDAYNQAHTAGSFDPTQAAGYQDALSQQQAAAQGLQNLGSRGGLMSNLATQYGKASPNGYSAGDAAFDAALLGQSQDAQGAFKAAQGQYGGLQDYLQTQTTAQAGRGAAAYDREHYQPPAPAGGAAPTHQTPVNPWTQGKIDQKTGGRDGAGGGDWDPTGGVDPQQRAPQGHGNIDPTGGTTQDPGPATPKAPKTPQTSAFSAGNSRGTWG